MECGSCLDTQFVQISKEEPDTFTNIQTETIIIYQKQYLSETIFIRNNLSETIIEELSNSEHFNSISQILCNFSQLQKFLI